MKKFKIVGAGLYGLTLGRILQDAGHSVTIYEKTRYLGGNCHTVDRCGIEIHEKGAHIFHTDDDEVIKFVLGISKFNNYRHRVFAEVSAFGKYVELPMSYKTLADMYGTYDTTILDFTLGESTSRMRTGNPELDELISQCSWDLFNFIIKPYSENQWGCSIDKVPIEAINRIRFKKEFTIGYFSDKFQGIPSKGYYYFFFELSKNLTIKYNSHITLDDLVEDDVTVIWSGDICESVNNIESDALPYRTVYFDHKEKDQGLFNSVINTPTRKYTRLIDHRLFRPEIDYNGQVVVSAEYPKMWTKDCGLDKMYPINNKENNSKYESIKSDILSRYPNVIFGGRLGEYKYYDMDDTIKSAINLSKKLLS